MSKLIVLVTIFVIVNGEKVHQDYKEGEIAKQAAAGNWDEVHRLLSELHKSQYKSLDTFRGTGLPPFVADVPVEKLAPKSPGERVYGERESTFIQTSYVDGQTSVNSGGQRVINNNGQVMKENFTPKIKM